MFPVLTVIRGTSKVQHGVERGSSTSAVFYTLKLCCILFLCFKGRENVIGMAVILLRGSRQAKYFGSKTNFDCNTVGFVESHQSGIPYNKGFDIAQQKTRHWRKKTSGLVNGRKRNAVFRNNSPLVDQRTPIHHPQVFQNTRCSREGTSESNK